MVSDPTLAQYIRQQMNRGYSKSQINDALHRAGWAKEQIDAAFYEAGEQTSAAPHRSAGLAQPAQTRQPGIPESPGLIWKLKNSLLHPNRLFEAVKSEGLEGAFIFTAIVYIIHLAMGIVVVLYLYDSFKAVISSYGLDSLLLLFMVGPFILVGYYLGALIGSFIQAGIIHFFVYILKGGRGFRETYKALMYSATPVVLVWLALPLLFINLLIGIFTFVVLYFVMSAWEIVLYVKGLSRLHGISTGKAVATIILPALIVVVLIAVAFTFALGVFNPSTYTGRVATGFGELGRPVDWSYSGTTIQIVLNNQAGQEIQVTEVSSPSCSSNTTQKTMPAGSTATFRLTGCARKDSGDSYSQAVTVIYSVESGMAKTAAGMLTGTAV